ncbi:MAG: phosphoglycerate dehydrogenase [Bdellovibrionota bacterium]
MSQTFKILIADGLAPEAITKLKALQGAELEDATGISRTDLMEKLPGVDILIVRSRTEVDKELLETSSRLKLAVRAGIGLDNVDVKAATERGVVVMNAPRGNTVTTAEHAMALMFAVSRRIPAADASLRAGKWEKKLFQGSQLAGKTLGIVGLGNIGKTLAKSAQGIGMHVVGFDPYVNEEMADKMNVKLLKLDELLADSDYISLHVPLTDGTRHIISSQAFSKMRKKPYLINCARGGIVDEKALEDALEKGLISGCALDVFEQEPPGEGLPLYARPNVVVTPHLGASTDEAQVQVGLEVADQVKCFIDQGVYINAVNVPNLSVEQLRTMKPHLKLCEVLGNFLGQVTPEKVTKITVHYEGNISKSYNEVLTLSVLKGYLTPLSSAAVNFVNAKNVARDRGICVEETRNDECPNFASLVRVTIEGAATLSCAGTLFGKGEPRIVNIDRMPTEAIPSGYILFTRNEDRPGVVGAVGSVLGSEGINIARMALGLNKETGQAIALISVDSVVAAETLDKLRKTEGMLSVQQVQL